MSESTTQNTLLSGYQSIRSNRNKFISTISPRKCHGDFVRKPWLNGRSGGPTGRGACYDCFDKHLTVDSSFFIKKPLGNDSKIQPRTKKRQNVRPKLHKGESTKRAPPPPQIMVHFRRDRFLETDAEIGTAPKNRANEYSGCLGYEFTPRFLLQASNTLVTHPQQRGVPPPPPLPPPYH